MPECSVGGFLEEICLEKKAEGVRFPENDFLDVEEFCACIDNDLDLYTQSIDALLQVHSVDELLVYYRSAIKFFTDAQGCLNSENMLTFLRGRIEELEKMQEADS
ncbi:MAG: hypothetical protein AAB893_01420 [Patescibacteria group bacterium]